MITLPQIQDKFERYGFMKNATWTGNQIKAKMDEMISTREMDREILDQILSVCNKSINTNLEQTYRMQDLAQTINDAIILLNNKIEKLKNEMKFYSEKQKKHQAQQSSASNSSEFKHINIIVNSVNNIPKRIQFKTCHLQIALGSQSMILKPIEHFDKANPEFNREIEFSIPPNIYLLTIQFYTKQSETDTTLPTLLGQAQLSIIQLDDNQKQMKLQLKDPLGKEVGCFVDVQAQIISNRLQYLLSQIGKSGEKIDDLNEQLKSAVYQLDMITRPFKKAEDFMRKDESQQQNQQESVRQDKPQESLAEPVGTSRFQIQTGDGELMHRVETEQPVEEYPQAPMDLDLGMTIFSYYGLITLFVCSAKPSFLDVLVCHGLMFTVFLDRFEPVHLKLVGAGLMASIIYDILWLSQYHSWWDSTDQNNPEWGADAAFFLKIVLVLTYIQFFYKFLVYYYLYQFYKESLDPVKTYIFKIWNIEYKVGKNRENVCWQ